MIKKRILSLWISLCVICIAGAQEKELAYCNRQIHKTLKAIGISSKLPRAIEAGKSSWVPTTGQADFFRESCGMITNTAMNRR